MSDYKQVIVMRTDLNMRKGKMVAQGAHASLRAILNFTTNIDDRMLILPLNMDTFDDIPISSNYTKNDENNFKALKEWIFGNYAKICVGIESEKELLSLYEKAQEANLLCSLITDSGLTEFHGVSTNTCIAIGPAKSEEIDKITGSLKLL